MKTIELKPSIKALVWAELTALGLQPEWHFYGDHFGTVGLSLWYYIHAEALKAKAELEWMEHLPIASVSDPISAGRRENCYLLVTFEDGGNS